MSGLGSGSVLRRKHIHPWEKIVTESISASDFLLRKVSVIYTIIPNSFGCHLSPHDEIIFFPFMRRYLAQAESLGRIRLQDGKASECLTNSRIDFICAV
jgi:hypothetical protein